MAPISCTNGYTVGNIGRVRQCARSRATSYWIVYISNRAAREDPLTMLAFHS
jgi:hypothetical protein